MAPQTKPGEDWGRPVYGTSQTPTSPSPPQVLSGEPFPIFPKIVLHSVRRKVFGTLVVLIPSLYTGGSDFTDWDNLAYSFLSYLSFSICFQDP